MKKHQGRLPSDPEEADVLFLLCIEGSGSLFSAWLRSFSPSRTGVVGGGGDKCPHKIECKLQSAFGCNPGVTSETGENDHFNSLGPSY